MGPTSVLSSPGGPHIGPMNLAIWDILVNCISYDFHMISNLSAHLYLARYYRPSLYRSQIWPDIELDTKRWRINLCSDYWLTKTTHSSSLRVYGVCFLSYLEKKYTARYRECTALWTYIWVVLVNLDVMYHRFDQSNHKQTNQKHANVSMCSIISQQWNCDDNWHPSPDNKVHGANIGAH